jgi:hypothetical protein
MPIIPKPLFIKITSHTQNQTVPANRPLKISGISSDNINSNGTVYTDWNDQKPLQQVTPTGPNGINDYSNWNFTYTSNYHLMTEGANELTSKLDCGNGQVKYYTVNVTGVYGQQPQLVGATADNNETTSSGTNDLSASSHQSTTANREPTSSFSSNTDDDTEDNGSDDSEADNSDNEDVIEEDIDENSGNNNDLFEEDDKTESSDEEIGDLFE